MIISIAIVSHSLLLLPQIQKKEENKTLINFLASYQELEGRLYQKKPDTLFFLSPHAPKESASFLINFNPTFKISFPHFGDFENYGEYLGESVLFSALTSYFRTKEFPLAAYSSEILDYGTGIPLALLASHLRETRILSLHTSEQLSDEIHQSFGEYLFPLLDESPRRIAIVVSLDLERNTSEMNEILFNAFKKNNLNIFTNREKTTPHDIHTCSDKPLLLLSGLLKETQYQSEILFYDAFKENNMFLALLHV